MGCMAGSERSKVMSLRLAEDLGAELAAVARADGMPISEAIRKAIEHYIEARRTDREFRERLKRLLEEDREILERFTK
jgi:metal-responsive CopG/Arc/MetJ family transcriptional regulator